MNQPHQCLPAIQACYADFSKTEKKIADYILHSPQSLVYKTIDEVAGELDIAISTVFRFSKRIGFKGFQAMKLALASELSQPIMEMVQDKITEHDNAQQITEKIFNNNIRMFKETIQVIDYASLKKAVNAIIKGNRIEFFGSGSSAIVALDAHHKFIGSGISTVAYTDFHLQLRSAAQLTEKDVLVLISHSGNDEDVLRILEIAKDNGATTIGMTNYMYSPLSKQVDIVLQTVSPSMEQRMDEHFSRIVQLSLIDSLYANVMSAKNGFMKHSLGKIKDLLW